MFCAYRFCDSSISRGKYCSLLCANREAGLKIKDRAPKQVCEREECENVFRGERRQRFCSHSCAAITNNKKRPRFCAECADSISHRGRFCDLCRKILNDKKRKVDYSSISLKEIKEKHTLSAFHAKIRGIARSVYKKSSMPMSCLICLYDKHVDICHIKAVASFDELTSVEKVNEIGNLMPLCKNHHWEFDNNALEEVDYKKLMDIIN